MTDRTTAGPSNKGAVLIEIDDGPPVQPDAAPAVPDSDAGRPPAMAQVWLRPAEIAVTVPDIVELITACGEAIVEVVLPLPTRPKAPLPQQYA